MATKLTFELRPFIESRVNKGMISQFDPADIDSGALQEAKNASIRQDKTSKRYGNWLMSPFKPDGETVLKIAYFRQDNGNSYTIRFTNLGVHLLIGNAWSAVTGALTGGINDRFNTLVAFNKFIFSNNGADSIRIVDTDLGVVSTLGNAPEYRFITAINDRIVGAALRGDNEVQVGWSATGVTGISEWDPAVNEEAGYSPLVTSPSDFSDYITGLFNFNNELVILRERSIWLGTPQPIPQAPFYFRDAGLNVGCNVPFSIQLTEFGLVWLDTRTQAIWVLVPGQGKQAISTPIESRLFGSIGNKELIFSGYNGKAHEYTLYVPQTSSSIVIGWTYNFQTQAWTYHIYSNVSSADEVELSFGALSADQLGDIPVDSLTGTADALSPNIIQPSVKVLGLKTGELWLENQTATLDDTLAIDFSLTSKIFTLPRLDIYVAEVRIEVEAYAGSGDILLEYYKDGRWNNEKVFSVTELGIPRIFKRVRSVKARRFAFRISSSTVSFSLVSYEVYVYESGPALK